MKHQSSPYSRSRGPRSRRARRWRLGPLLVPLVALATTNASAAPDLVVASPDITIDLIPGAGSDLVTDQDLAADNLLGIVVEESLGSFVAGRQEVSVVGYHDEGGGRRLIVFDEPIQLFGTVPSPGDVVRYSGGTDYSVIFDASAEGIPPGVEVDAVARGLDGELVLSFTTHVDFGSFTAADEDLVRFDGTDFSMVFDASSFGIPASLDLDGASYDDATGNLFVSFDSDGDIEGVLFFSDEDVVEFDPVTGLWVRPLAFEATSDGSGNAASWRAADVEAIQVPEPGFAATLAVGVLGLARATRRSKRSPVREGVA